MVQYSVPKEETLASENLLLSVQFTNLRKLVRLSSQAVYLIFMDFTIILII